MAKLQEFVSQLSLIAPLSNAESWDNVGLLLGDLEADAKTVMTCLTVSSKTVHEAIEREVDLIVVHHPCPFKPLSNLTNESAPGKWLLKLASNGIAVYSPHTAWDNAEGGINDQLANLIGLRSIEPMIRTGGANKGRIGSFESPHSIDDVIQVISKSITDTPLLFAISDEDARGKKIVKNVGIVCGSGASFLSQAKLAGCEMLITGEANYHQYLDAEAMGVALLTIGHFASESFSMATLASKLKAVFPDYDVFRSQSETDSSLFN